MTTLSPSLSHLLITPDPHTGHLVMPDGRRLPPMAHMQLDNSPPGSPAWSAEPSPFIPKLLPPPRSSVDRGPISSVWSFLNDRPASSPSPTAPTYSSSVSTRPVSHNGPIHQQHRYDSPSQHVPHLAEPRMPYRSDPRLSLDYQYPMAERRVSGVQRPDAFRRHTQPYPPPYPRPSEEEFTHMMGASRAPISRTTKACNACRSRKVRCDAGGQPNGQPSTCSRCREACIECVYSGSQKKRGPCPGTVRSANGTRRRQSNRSSIASVATTRNTTPPSDDEPSWSARSSLSQPDAPPTKWSYEHTEHIHQPRHLAAQPPSLAMEAPKSIFRPHYSMRPDNVQARLGRAGPSSISPPPTRPR